VTSTVPVPAGAVVVTCASETALKLLAAVVPKETPAAPVNPEP
jgi:hypothetical protein